MIAEVKSPTALQRKIAGLIKSVKGAGPKPTMMAVPENGRWWIYERGKKRRPM